MDGQSGYVFVTPSLKVSGGTLEIVKLARDLASRGRAVRIIALWSTDDAIDTGSIPVATLSAAGFSLGHTATRWPVMMARFGRALAASESAAGPGWHVVFSHYSTFVLVPAVPLSRRWFIVQDTEWRFARAGAYRAAVRRFIVAALRRGRVLTTNRYLTDAMAAEGVATAAQVDIWADPAFAGRLDAPRDIDLVLMLRHGAHKRADLGIALIEWCRAAKPTWRIAVITPERVLADRVTGRADLCLLSPDLVAMRALYERSRLFVLLSDHEGFGLPPLEAMGSGCVPLCRDAGGIRSYLTGELEALLVPPAADVDAIVERAAALLADDARWAMFSGLAAARFREGVAAQAGRLDSDWAAAIMR